MLQTRSEMVVYNTSIYLRVSKEDAEAALKGVASNSIKNQKQLILNYLKDKPEFNIVSIRVDDGYTGTNYDRPAFQLMLEDIKAGRVNCVVVKDLSRFGREYIDAGKYIYRLFPFLGVRLIAINDNVDTITRDAGTDFSITFRNLINDNYCRDISIKIRSQLQVKRQNGDFIGPFAPYGYQKDEKDHNQLVIDPYAAGIVEDIFRWRIGGLSNQMIANRLAEQGVLCPAEYKRSQGKRFRSGYATQDKAHWTQLTVGRILTNTVYLGTLTQGVRRRPNYKIKTLVQVQESEWVVVENAHEAIIDPHTFALAQKVVGLDTRTPPGSGCIHPLSGLLICGDCGSPIVRKPQKSGDKVYDYYVCKGNKTTGRCSSHRIAGTQMEAAVLELLKEHINLLEQMESCLETIRQRPGNHFYLAKCAEREAALDREVQRYRHLKSALYEDMKDGLISKEDFCDIRGQYDARLADADMAREKLRQEVDLLSQGKEYHHQWIQEFTKYRGVKTLTREMVVECIDEIRLFENRRIEVEFAHSQEFEHIMREIAELQNSAVKIEEAG